MIDEGWLRAAIRGCTPADSSSESTDAMWAMLRQRAPGFQRSKGLLSSDIAEPRRGLLHDESASFLSAVASGFADVDQAGFVTLPSVRPKAPEGRYALFSKNGDGMAVNLEYLIQIGAAAELVTEHGWAATDIGFERGEFDAFAHDSSGHVVVAMEAKARSTGADSLEKLVRSWLRFAADPAAELDSNAGRKWRQLLHLVAVRPVLVWLVADGARWSLWATKVGDTIDLSPGPPPNSQVG